MKKLSNRMCALMLHNCLLLHWPWHLQQMIQGFSACSTFTCLNIQLIRISIRSTDIPELVTKSYRLFMDRKRFLLNTRYNGNSHIRLIRPIMLLSRQQVITRQGKSTKEVQQFFLFNAKMVFIFVTICIQICLNYNCFQEIFGEKYFPQFKWRLHESSVWLSASGVGRVELMSLIKSVDFHHFGVSSSFLTIPQILPPGCHWLHHCCIRALL